MYLFLEILWVKKCRNLKGGGYFPVTVNIFPVPNLELPFFLRSFV